eukprot:GFUD01017773.1.p1 GENE.GFUD01017773.1~~GFUD01017773.1.p1  ORF type:complete len:252 (-),score=79.11 GFUD01017773.1:15-770(-)
MAKWGEGDPRWIVEERPDATNVNNWHWTEKNADRWSKSKIKELFTNHLIEDPGVGRVWVEGVERCEGEARVNSRKGKIILFYEWDIVLCWKGNVAGSSNEIRGRIEIPNFSEEHDDMQDVDIETRLVHSGPEAEALRNMIRKGKGSKEIRFLLGVYVSQLRGEYSSGVILPKKGDAEVRQKETARTLQTTRAVASVDRNTGQGTKKADNQEKKRLPKKRKSWKKNDFVFYVSLFSLVGISSIVVVKLVKRL